MGEQEMRLVGRLIAEVLHDPQSEEVRRKVREAVTELTAQFPLYPQRLKQRAPQPEAMGAD
jgi:glycine/serine hydroxymethyltransferase